MRNNRFVTDSDTERELRAWQTERETPIDEEKLRQQYKNRQNNAQGQHFEREILAGCRMYQQHGIAAIDKTPEPFRVSKKSQNGIFTGRFSTPAQPEMYGRQYLKAEDIGKYKVRFDGAVHFLDKLIKEIIYRKTANIGKSDRILDNIEGATFYENIH